MPPRRERPRARAAALALVSLLGACNPLRVDPETDALSRRVLALAEAGDSASLHAVFHPKLLAADPWGALRQVRDTLALLRPDTMELVGYNINATPEGMSSRYTYQSHGGGGWFLASVETYREAEALLVTGVNVQRLPNSLQELNAFTLAGRGWRHYLVLLLALTSAVVCLGAAIVIARTPMPRRWRWVLVSMLGAGQVTINWATGEMTVSSVFLMLFGAGVAHAGPAGPWSVAASFPAGALIALAWRERYLKARKSIVVVGDVKGEPDPVEARLS